MGFSSHSLTGFITRANDSGYHASRETGAGAQGSVVGLQAQSSIAMCMACGVLTRLASFYEARA